MALTAPPTNRIRGYGVGSVIKTVEPVAPASPVLATPVSISPNAIGLTISSFPSDADSVTVYYSIASANDWSVYQAGIPESAAYAERTDVTTAQSYDFYATAQNAYGVSVDSAIVTGAAEAAETVPVAPSSFVITPLVSGGFSGTWTINSSNETGFRIYHWDGDDWDTNIVAAVGAGVSSVDEFFGTFTAANGQQGFRMRAYNGVGNSAVSNEDWRIPDESSSGAPGAAVISVSSPSSTTLQAAVVTPPTDYVSLQWYISSVGPSDPSSWSAISGETDLTPSAITGLTEGNERWLDLRATNASGTTSSNIVKGTVTGVVGGGATVLFELETTSTSAYPSYVGSGSAHAGGGYISFLGGEVNHAYNPGDGDDSYTTFNNVIVDASTDAADSAYGTTRALKTQYKAGSHQSFQNNTTIIKFPSQQKIYVRLRQKWSSNFNFGGQQKFCKNLGSGVSTNCPHFTGANPDGLGNGNRVPMITKLSPPNPNLNDTWHFAKWTNGAETGYRKNDDTGFNNSFGAGGTDANYRIVNDQWYWIEWEIDCGTADTEDGYYKIWIDGQLYMQLTDVQVRQAGDGTFTSVELQHVLQGTPNVENTPTWMADIYIATERSNLPAGLS